MIRKPLPLMFYILFSISILAACAKPTEIVTLPPPTVTQVPATKTPLKPTATQVPATKTLPPPTDTPAMPTQALEQSPTSTSISEMAMTERVSVASDGTQGNSVSYAPVISADGRYVTFSSNASNLVEGDTNRVVDIFVHDRVTGVTQRVSVASDGAQGYDIDNWITSSISADGRYVAFKSGANNLVEGDTNGSVDCFVYDRLTGETIRVSVASNGAEGNSDGVAPAISADGRYIAFVSYAPSIREGDTNLYENIFVYDRITGQMTLESVSSEGIQGNYSSVAPSISADGRYVAFKSGANNLVEGDTNGSVDCFVYDRLTGETTRASVASDGTQANGSCGFYPTFLIFGPSISADGRYVAFSSYATNLVERFTKYPNIWGYMSIYLHDLVTGKTSLVSISSDGTQANGSSWLHAISADGRYVAFSSDATNLVEGVTDGYESIYLHDRVTGETKFVSISNYVTNGDERFWGSSISADGRYIAFASSADNLVKGDTNGVSDIFVRDLGTSKQPVASRPELFGVWKGLWSTDHYVLMVFIPTMMPWVAFEEDVGLPGDNNGIEWFNVEGGILTFGAWVKGAWVKPFSASTDCVNNPQATYEVYITYLDDQPEKLRFVLVGEDHCIDRQTFLDGQTLTWVGTYPH